MVEHSEELRQLSGQLATQKNLSSKYSDKVLEAEKALRVKALSLREVQRELTVEKTVSSRFYDEVGVPLVCLVLCGCVAGLDFP